MGRDDVRDQIKRLLPQEGQTWAGSKRGREVLERVLHDDTVAIDETPSGQSSGRRVWRARGIIVAAMLAIGVLVIVLPMNTWVRTQVADSVTAPSKAQHSSTPSQRSESRVGSAAPGFSTLAEMVDRASTIVAGRTTGVLRADEPCPGISSDDCVPYRVTVEVSEQLLGKPTTSSIVVNIDTYAGDPLTQLLPKVGDRVIYVLTPITDWGFYNPVTPLPTPYSISTEGRVEVPPGPADPVSQKLAGRPWEEVRDLILAEVRD